MEYVTDYYIRIREWCDDESEAARTALWNAVDSSHRFHRGEDGEDAYRVSVLPSRFEEFRTAARNAGALVYEDRRMEEYVL